MSLNSSASNPNTLKVIPASIERVGIDRGQCSWFERPMNGNNVGDRLVIVDQNLAVFTWDGYNWTSTQNRTNQSRRFGPSAPQIVATRGRMPIASDGAGASNYTRFESSHVVRIGPKTVNAIQLIFCNRYATSSGETFTDINDAQIESSVYSTSPTAKMYFNGALSPVLASGAPFVITDKLGNSLPANSFLQLRTGLIVQSGQKVPTGSAAVYQTTKVASTAAVSQIYATSSIATPSGGAVTTYAYTPLAVIGVPSESHPAVILWGDSITYGSGDVLQDSVYGHVGWGERGLIGAASGGFNIPFVNVSKSGDGTSSYTNAGYFGTRFALFEYASHIVFALGINDMASTSLDTIKSRMLEVWDKARSCGCYAYQTTLTPNTSSTDNWSTPQNQTITANCGPLEKRGQINDWIKTQVAAGTLDGVIDINSAVEDPNNLGKWLSNGTAQYATADGLHPTTAGHILMANVLKTEAQKWA